MVPPDAGKADDLSKMQKSLVGQTEKGEKRMKALSVKSPWAEQIRSGKKKIEYRSWRTSYRGPLLICCSKFPDSKFSGLAICIVDLVDIKFDGRLYNWIIINPKPIKPFPVRGQLSLFEVQFSS